MTPCKALRLPVLGVVAATAMAATHPATAQNISLNYESLSSLEEPIATEIGDVTVLLTGLVDTSLTRDTEDDDASGADLIGNFQLSALTQLSNRWRVGLTYFGQYARSGSLPRTGRSGGRRDSRRRCTPPRGIPCQPPESGAHR